MLGKRESRPRGRDADEGASVTSESNRFGLLGYSPVSHNLGDEIQSLAARALLPRVDAVIVREEIDRDPGFDLKMLLNGWFSHDARAWPPHPRIAALPVSLHLDATPRRRFGWPRSTIGEVLVRTGKAYFSRFGPVGARDRATLQLLQNHGIASVYSGCLTLTLPSRNACRGGEVVICDLDERATMALERRIGSVRRTTHVTGETSSDVRFALAQDRLDLYAGARSVITSRLHCALPCLAMGVPVLFVGDRADPRLQPAADLAHACSPEDLVEGRSGFDPLDPPPNPERHLELAESLRQRCATFLGG
jgi:hypothetical protein